MPCDHATVPCYHGGAFFSAIGERFDDLGRSRDIINADVLDAWFPPAPAVLAELTRHLAWLARTSPPAQCSGMLEVIAGSRGVPVASLVPGAGSSDLIFRAFTRWMTPSSRVVILDPMYGEYAHVLEHVIGCEVIRLRLEANEVFDVNAARLAEAVRGADWLVMVNPNSPTGRYMPGKKLEALLRSLPAGLRVWIDETYVDYAGTGESVERYAANSRHVVVCKSLSKVFALSGLRAAYLCAPADMAEELRGITPPWVVGLPAQVAVVRAHENLAYYREMWQLTAALREELAEALEAMSCRVVPGVGNMILAFLPCAGPTAMALIDRCRLRGFFLRDASGMGTGLGPHAVRIAVKDTDTNRRMLEILRDELCPVETLPAENFAAAPSVPA